LSITSLKSIFEKSKEMINNKIMNTKDGFSQRAIWRNGGNSPQTILWKPPLHQAAGTLLAVTMTLE
jgi:hypothetical protein